jgi:hypothetical protein
MSISVRSEFTSASATSTSDSSGTGRGYDPAIVRGAAGLVATAVLAVVEHAEASALGAPHDPPRVVNDKQVSRRRYSLISPLHDSDVSATWRSLLEERAERLPASQTLLDLSVFDTHIVPAPGTLHE